MFESKRSTVRKVGRFFVSALAASILVIPHAFAQSEAIIYPDKGQSKEQQEQDQFQCYTWAKQQSGFDPMAPPTAKTAPPPQEAPVGGAGQGLFRGAVTGLAIGAIAGDAGKGAAIGATAGGLFGGMRRADQRAAEEQKQQQWANQEVAQYEAGRNTYNRAFAACMEGRGYTVR